METTGNAPWEVLEWLLPYLDLWLYDLKLADKIAAALERRGKKG